MRANGVVLVSLFEEDDRMDETADHAVTIDVERRIISDSSSVVGIALVPVGLYFCVGLATFRGLSEFRGLKTLQQSKMRKEPMKRKCKKGTSEENNN